MKHASTASILIVIVLGASLLRLPHLAQRPMHCDEAVHADKFGVLLEQGRYEYSTVDYHGPTLYYLTLLPARLQGATRYSEISEVTLRSLPAVLGVLFVAAHLLLAPHIGSAAALCAALLAALSPAMGYYSRYYIHETLLVFFTFATLLTAFGYFRQRRLSWAIATGACVGLMLATKETGIIAAAAMISAVLLTIACQKLRGTPGENARPVSRAHVTLAAATAISTSALLYSSFLSNPKGVLDALHAIPVYLLRGTGAGTLHVHPWNYYFTLLLGFHTKGGPFWTEGLIVVLAVCGAMASFRRKGLPGMSTNVTLFLSFYTLMMVLVYSAMPYKAPWNLLGFLHGMVLLAGIGAAWLFGSIRTQKAKAAAGVLLAAAALHLGWRSWAASFRYEADPRNPWVYAHTGRDVFLIVQELELLAKASSSGRSMPVQIISRENLWPLPWYLRRFTDVRWADAVYDSAAAAPVIIATPDVEPALVRKLYEVPPPGRREMYVHVFDRYVELRPQVELRMYAVKSLWDKYQRGDN